MTHRPDETEPERLDVDQAAAVFDLFVKEAREMGLIDPPDQETPDEPE